MILIIISPSYWPRGAMVPAKGSGFESLHDQAIFLLFFITSLLQQTSHPQFSL